ncbi:helix-turn-helix transcriptional regulator [Acidithiobacillus thiooxidans]|uniref:helix-turn-helix domain-containing protein n=1 Tax=Acidithiobacillus thiooxidans TaxID=930 RepID=UPI001C0655FF|nr:helix-turn-helix domain-containing protein [Acidithiobacillus thiooxidans]MBU2840243.1 helix-turn-helix transcriptional regulator [Acidithiobacillus thiooxidans]
MITKGKLSWAMHGIESPRPEVEFKKMRIVAGMTQQQCAEFLTVGIRTIRRWESGECRIPIDAWQKLERHVAVR